MNWFKRKIRKWAEVDDVETKAQKRIDNFDNHHIEDYKALAKRISALEEEVFDCSDDENKFPDEE
jgi:hypothetical protein